MTVHDLRKDFGGERATETVTVDKTEYTTVITIRKTSNMPACIQLKENNIAAATYKVQVSIYGSVWSDLQNDDGDSEFSIDKNGSAYRVVFEPWIYVQVVAHGDTSDDASVTVDVSSG